MDESSTELKSRRSFLEKGATLLGGIASLPVPASFRKALATGKLAKADVKYQDMPSTGKDCDDCLHFISGATPDAKGTCKVVDGVISAHGYCAAFTFEPKQN